MSTISFKDFSEWSSSNMYRTSYRNMHKLSPVKNKDYAIPGYSGHIPGKSADNAYGKRFTAVSREQFSREKFLPPRITDNFPQRPVSLSPYSSRGSKFGGGLAEEYQTVSRFHGKSTLPLNHPNYSGNNWETNYGSSFKNQEKFRGFLYRKSDSEEWKKTPVLKGEKNKASGFDKNSTLFDGYGWSPIKKLHGDLSYSEYRSRFNPEKKFHPLPFKAKLRKLRAKKLVY